MPREGPTELPGPFLETRASTLGNSYASPTLIRFTKRYADYCCLGFAPSVERLLSGFLLSDALAAPLKCRWCLSMCHLHRNPLSRFLIRQT